MKIFRSCTFVLALAGSAWLLAGAGQDGEPQLWSLQPIGNPTPPAPGAAWQRNAIDAFVAQRPVAQAARRALIRRASYDLTGLPPAVADVEKFVADPRSDAAAFASVVEQLLASPHYGEHWGRHWLDVVRYADTAGENSDHPLPHAWRYRNWVIAAFNADLPYDRFVQQQLAGDLLPDAGADGVVATGYLAIARRFGHDIDQSMHLTYEDAIDNLGKAFLGLSISCARCHDHKHDPISNRDYYALYGVLESTRLSFPGCEPTQRPRDLIPLASDDLLAKQAAWQQRNAALADEINQSEKVQALVADDFQQLAKTCSSLISSGDVPDGGSVVVTPEPIEIDLHKGEAILLSILPRANHGADTTMVELSIAGAGQSWSVADLIDDLGKANPNGPWCFLDTAAGIRFLPEQMDSIDGRAELGAWRNGDTPSVFVNRSSSPVKVWTELPPRTFFVHPGKDGPVAVAWLSPLDGKVSVRLKVGDGHPGGDGVAWRLEHLASTEIGAGLDKLAGFSSQLRSLIAQRRDHEAATPAIPFAYAVAEGSAPKSTRLQLRGNPEDLGEEVPRAFLSALGGSPLGDARSSGRLELAQLIASRDNPLTARVMANRIWAWHFGTGIVATPNDFGNHGAAPTNPQLLDFLARYFIDHGWSTKAMHRLIMASATYQQAAVDGGTVARHRLSAEELRDTLLSASGDLDLTPGSAHPFPPEDSWGFTQHAPFAADYPNNKRSVYLMRKRNRNAPFFALFDGADANASTPVRGLTTSPTQALYFMNDPFFHRCAEGFTKRVLAHSDDRRSRLDFACRELFSRPATDAELTAFKDFARATGTGEAAAWGAYARILLGSNELIHLD